MIGVFDSGSGGVSTVKYLRTFLPSTDVVFLADTKNAPYGNKSENELCTLIEKNVKRLVSMGAEKILMACCTASSLWEKLSPDMKNITRPIICPTVESLPDDAKKILVISTAFTASSHAFSNAIHKEKHGVTVIEMPMQNFVNAIESARNHGLSPEENIEVQKNILALDKLILKHSPDTLILGCTHFSWLEDLLFKRYKISIINPAEIGAQAIANEENHAAKSLLKYRQSGKIIYTT